jgi:hypothetical protein
MIKTFKLFGLLIAVILTFTDISPAQTILKQGSQSKVETPFIFVARDVKTYAQLQNLVEDLPAATTIDFKKNAVVAGFAGEKPTGGFAVEIKQTGKKYSLDVSSPGKDMMVTQIITTPFKVWQIPLDENEALELDFATSFTKGMKTFQVTKGDFGYSGGIAGIRRKFKANGTIKMLNHNDYTTILFALKGTGNDAKRQLSAIASGILQKESIEVFRLDAGTFVETPNPSFSVKGRLKGKNLSLNFAPLPSNVADGFAGKGSLTANQIK